VISPGTGRLRTPRGYYNRRIFNIQCFLFTLVACYATVIVLLCFGLYMRPEYIGYQFHSQWRSPNCFVMEEGFKTGGNANRIQALFHAFHLAERRKFKYIAFPEDWQKWMCKLYSEKSINNFPVPVVPVDGYAGCPEVFGNLSKTGIRNRWTDSCEYWHLANFFRLPWYSPHTYRLSDWKYYLPTAHQYREKATTKLENIRKKHKDKKILTVHKRWLSVWCTDKTEFNPSPSQVDRWCHISPAMVLEQLAIANISKDNIYGIVSSDGYMKVEDVAFQVEGYHFQTEEVSFMTQVWMWILSDIHVGNPHSTIDHMACRFRRLLCEEHANCNPCYPKALQDAALEGFLIN